MDRFKYFYKTVELPVDSESTFSCESARIDELGTLATEETVEDIIEENRKYETEQKLKDEFSRITQATFSLPCEDEFFRSYLLEHSFTDTLNAFQTEWIRKVHQGSINTTEVQKTPDVYAELEESKRKLSKLDYELTTMKKSLLKQKEEYRKLQKEKHYHSLMHRRLLQEKLTILDQVKRIQKHYEEYGPLLKHMQKKYEVAMREKTLNGMERDRAIEHAEDLRSTLVSLQKLGIITEESNAIAGTDDGKEKSWEICRSDRSLDGFEPTKGKRNVTGMIDRNRKRPDAVGKVCSGRGIYELPRDTRVNPLLSKLTDSNRQSELGQTRKLILSIQAHETPASGLSVHLNKPLVCSAGDDKRCKLWIASTLTPVITFEAHEMWISSCELNPREDVVATASGDGEIQLWRLDLDCDLLAGLGEEPTFIGSSNVDPEKNKAEHTATLRHHIGAVWSLCWHWEGRFLASGGLDGIICIWDTEKAKSIVKTVTAGRQFCKLNLRKHHGSVNSVSFLPYGNIMVSTSVDKTVSLWDVRSGICIRSLLGHKHTVNHATFSQQGNCIASCDSGGFLRVWDLRRLGLQPDTGKDITLSKADLSHNHKPHSDLAINQLAFDLSGKYIAAACADANIGYLELATKQMSYLQGHDDAVQSVVFDYNTDHLYSIGNDGRICVWK